VRSPDPDFRDFLMMKGSVVPALVVFSDLDGTLLDHETYSFEPARPALEALRGLGLPLVLASSKTAVEISVLRRQIGVEDCPAIVENGAGILPPGPFRPGANQIYARLRAALDALPRELRSGFAGFGDWSAAEITRRTGLTAEQAGHARQRQFSEPGIWSGGDEALAAFLDRLASLGISACRGGRFLTLSFGASKADRMSEILRTFAAPQGPRPSTLALGDAPNDVEMLEAADFGVIIANPGGAELPPLCGEAEGRIRRSSNAGPAGWNDGVLDRLEEIRILTGSEKRRAASRTRANGS
jgi:mannosyl-3-phosphoglycerate phosphatase